MIGKSAIVRARHLLLVNYCCKYVDEKRKCKINVLQMPEEESFAVFLRIMEEYRMREIYKPAMTELGLCMFQLECLVQVMNILYSYNMN
jgi:hypothetical protein